MRKVGLFPDDAVYHQMSSPVGQLTMVASERGLHAVLWDNQTLTQSLSHRPKHPVLQATKQQLTEYFAGRRKKFELPLCPEGTDFQRQAWTQLQKIPYSTTITYGEQAKRLGSPNKARAVGMANGKNPLSIVIPCHRVIGRNGKLTGFAGGLDKKAYLLDFENRNRSSK